MVQGTRGNHGIMLNLNKVYDDDGERLFDSTMDNLDRKFMLFMKICDQAEMLEKNIHCAFSIILTWHTRQFVMTFKKKHLNLDSLVESTKFRYSTPERTRA